MRSECSHLASVVTDRLRSVATRRSDSWNTELRMVSQCPDLGRYPHGQREEPTYRFVSTWFFARRYHT